MAMRSIFLLCLILVINVNSFANNGFIAIDTIEWKKISNNKFDLHYSTGDEKEIATINLFLNTGFDFISEFFNQPFTRKVDVYIFPARELLDKQWQKDWGDISFKSQCWMIASGVAHRLDILSPAVWNKQACDHNGNDTTEIRQVTWHELVHVFHGQHNPDHTFNYIEKLDWLVEGVATYASGQLNENRLQRIKRMTLENKTPSTLDDFWKGADRYGLAGSMVGYIDKVYGRNKLFELLRFTNKNDALQFLGITESQLIYNWRNSVN